MTSGRWGCFEKSWRRLTRHFRGLPGLCRRCRFNFSDFIHWQKQLFENGAFDRQVVYWQKRLDGLSPALQFQREAKRKSSPHARECGSRFSFEDVLVTQIKSFAQRPELHALYDIRRWLGYFTLVLHRRKRY